MEPAFWHSKWEQDHIGFNEATPHRYLISFYPQLKLTAGDSIFVPLCGKSVDLCWLADKGLNVLGIELSEIAIRDFFEEHNLTPSKQRLDAFTLWKSGNIELLHGDFFDLQAKHVMHCAAVYDRAAIIALPQPSRAEYAAHLQQITTAQTRYLTICLEYPQHQKSGPPFSVLNEELINLFKDNPITQLASEDVLHTHPHFEKNGMTSLIETAYIW